jgi:hypothetical protein
MNHLSFTVEILAAQRRDGKGASAPVIAFEEGQRIAARDDTGALVMQTWRWVALEECDVMGVRWWKAFEGEGCCEAAERGSDLWRGVRGVFDLVTGSLRAWGAPTMTMFKLEAAAWGNSSVGVGGAPLVTAMALEKRAARTDCSEDVARWRPWRGETSAAALPLPACVRKGRWWWSCLDPCALQLKRAIEGHRPAWTVNRCHGKWGGNLRVGPQGWGPDLPCFQNSICAIIDHR